MERRQRRLSEKRWVGSGVAAREKVPEMAEVCIRIQRSVLGIRTHPKRSPSLFNYKSRENTNCITNCIKHAIFILPISCGKPGHRARHHLCFPE